MGYKYDVFVSFRGREVRNTFVDHLFVALLRKNINPFRDTTDLSLGGHIGEGIQLAIETSRLYVVVLTADYASSAWCLDELVRMMECAGKRKGSCSASSTVVIPIFYNVSLDDIRRCYKDEIRRHSGEYSPGRVIGWIEAIDRVVQIAGKVFNSQRPESELMDEIVAKLRRKLSVRKRLTCQTRRIINRLSAPAQANTTAQP